MITKNQMPPLTTRKAKLILVAIAAFVVLFLAWGVHETVKFKIVALSPKKTLPTSTNEITIKFNKELKNIGEQPENYIKIDPATSYTTILKEKTLTIKLLEPGKDGTTMKIDLNDITEMGGDTLSSSIMYDVKYIPFNKLSKEEQARQTAATKNPAESNPLLKKLPHDEISFRIDYVPDSTTFGTANTWQEEKDNYVVTIATFARKDGVTPEVYAEKSKALRTQAIDWIKKQGVNPDTDINIVYAPSDDELSGQEFTGDGSPPEDLDPNAIPAYERNKNLAPSDIVTPSEIPEYEKPKTP